MKKLFNWTSVIILLICVVTAYGLKEYNRKQINTANLELFAEKKANDIVREFEADEKKANGLYNDKAMIVEGKIQSIDFTDSTQRIILSGEAGSAGVICEFTPEEGKKIQSLAPGKIVRIKGVCTGFLMDVILVRCILQS